MMSPTGLWTTTMKAAVWHFLALLEGGGPVSGREGGAGKE